MHHPILYRRRAQTYDKATQQALADAARVGDAAALRNTLQAPRINPAESADKWHSHTLLHLAAAGGHAEAVQVLLNDGRVDVNCKDAEGRTALWSAAGMGHTDATAALLGCSRADPQLADAGQRTPFFAACAAGHDTIVNAFVVCPRVDLSRPDANGCTPFWMACKQGHLDTVKTLMAVDAESENCAANEDEEEGPNVASRQVGLNTPSKSGCTPLRMACSEGHCAVVCELLASGRVNVNTADTLGCTPVVIVCARGHLGLAHVLLEHPEVDLQHKTTSKRTPLHVAAAHGHEALVRALLRDGRAAMQLWQRDSGGATPLAAASEEGHTEVVRLLINSRKRHRHQLEHVAEENNDDNQDNNNGANEVGPEPSIDPLHHAAAGGHADIVRMLVRDVRPPRHHPRAELKRLRQRRCGAF